MTALLSASPGIREEEVYVLADVESARKVRCTCLKPKLSIAERQVGPAHGVPEFVSTKGLWW
jgi:hypothetical protein